MANFISNFIGIYFSEVYNSDDLNHENKIISKYFTVKCNTMVILVGEV